MSYRHIVLAGDSIFDNDGYVPEGPGVLAQLARGLPKAWSCSKSAVDGDCLSHIKDQIRTFPPQATDVVVSVGGNDARQHSHLLSGLRSVEDLSRALEAPVDAFRRAYGEMLDAVGSTGLGVQVCTIYTAIPFQDPVWRRFVPLALARFNDAICAEAAARGVPVLRLDRVCVAPGDFSAVSPIEPSVQGGQKIVDHILAHL